MAVVAKPATAGKQAIFRKLGFSAVPDRKPFIESADAEKFSYTANVYFTKQNKGLQEDRFVIYGNNSYNRVCFMVHF
jgi:hypothetical protein